MDTTIKHLFLRYILNQCTREEIDQVISLIRENAYQQEWLAAMELAAMETDFDSRLTADHKAGLYAGILKKANLKPVATKNNWWKYSAAAVVLLIAGVLLSRHTFNREVLPAEEQLASVGSTEGAMVPMGKKWIKLPDGTSVQLNSNSKIDYPDSFNGLKERRVTLTGEAYFDVKHQASQPFVIQAGKLKVTVLGTAFNIKSSADQQSIVVTVTRGRVKVQRANQVLGLLSKDQQLSWQANEKIQPVKLERVNTGIATAWKADDLIMDDVTLAEAADILAKRYRLKVTFENPALRQCKFTAAFLERNELAQILSVIGDITNTKLTVDQQQTLTLSGTGCN